MARRKKTPPPSSGQIWNYPPKLKLFPEGYTFKYTKGNKQGPWVYAFGFRLNIFFKDNMLCDFGAVGFAHHPTSH